MSGNTALLGSWVCAGCLAAGVSFVTGLHAAEAAAGDLRVVTYEAFGAVGDGVADDLPAICKAHDHANERGLPVRSNPQATYHLGRRALTAVIETDTDWSTSRFVIDDSKEVENHRQPLFEVRSRLQPLPLKIERLKRGQKRLDLLPPSDCLVRVEQQDRRRYIRRGVNQNAGKPQNEVFILRRDGSIDGGIDWDYDRVTSVVARPIDPVPLHLRGGVFTRTANRMVQQKGYNYWARNIKVRRSRTVIDGITHRVTGETEVGHPYSGFLSISQCADILLRDCRIDGHRTYQTIGSAGKPVSMGTYGYSASHVVNFRMIRCRMDDIHDRSRWGVIGTNYMKNILLEDCELSRMDVHQGVSGAFIIRRTTLGHAGLNAIGRGRLSIEDSTLHGRHLVNFRSDYGSTWQGDVIIRNCRWIPPGRNPEIIGVGNDGAHDHGYPCSMPRVVSIEGLFIDDSKHGKSSRWMAIFSDPGGTPGAGQPFPYRPTERLEVSGLRTASGLKPVVSRNPALAELIGYRAK